MFNRPKCWILVQNKSPKEEGSCSGAFENWLEASEYCYQKVDEPRNWFDAKTSCAELGGTLVTIYSDAVQNALNEHSDGVDRWIGLKKNELEDGKIYVKPISILEQSNFLDRF